PRLGLERRPRVLLHALLEVVRELLAGEGTSGVADDREPGRQHALVAQRVERRRELAVGQVPRRAEDHDRAGRRRDFPRKALAERREREFAHATPFSACSSRSTRRASACGRSPSRWTRKARRLRPTSASKSPWAWASSRTPNEYGAPGIGTSERVSA